MPDEPQRVGEVVEASTASLTAQCYELYRVPPLGSLVKTGGASSETYGIVYHAATTSLEPGRRPIARGRDEASEEAIYESNPQLTRLLCSQFSALLVGHRQEGRLYRHLPPLPPHIHGFVYLCPRDEIGEFSRSLDFLNIVLNTSLPVPAVELVAACLRQMSAAHEDRRAFLLAAGRELAALLSDDLGQLRAILERVAE